jgi:hypothetical protein
MVGFGLGLLIGLLGSKSEMDEKRQEYNDKMAEMDESINESLRKMGRYDLITEVKK